MINPLFLAYQTGYHAEKFNACSLKTLPSQNNWREDLICPECKHTIFPSNSRYGSSQKCQCSNCIKKENKKKDSLIELIKSDNEHCEKLNYENLALESKLYLAVILQEFHAKALQGLGNYEQYANVLDFNPELLHKLYSSGILAISPNSNWDSFADVDISERHFRFHPDLVQWDVWIQSNTLDEKSLLASLKNPNKGMVVDEDETTTLYSKVVITELKRLFSLELKRLRFEVKYDTEMDLISDALHRWITKYTPAEIYYLIYISVRRADNKRTSGEWGNYKFHPIHFIVKTADNVIMSYSQRHIPFQQYNYPIGKQTPLLQTQIFFNQILILPNWFNQIVPVDDDTLSINSIASISSKKLDQMITQRIDDTSLIKSLVPDVKWFAISKYGIIVNDENVDWLFTDQLTAYEYAKQMCTNDNNKNLNWTTRIIRDGNFYIQNFYSINFLILLVNALRNAKVAEKQYY